VSGLIELSQIRSDRARLDDRELRLIERARHEGATWVEIAAALGLSSRQAAQQRHQRLIEAARVRRHALDVGYAPQIAALRAAVADIQRWIDADRRWDSRFRRAGLVRNTVAATRDAEPGALFALATHIADDLAQAGTHRLPKAVQRMTAALAIVLSTNH
jgi:hypothetical protein